MIGHEIVVTVLSIERDHVRLGFQAPRDVEVHREEVYKELQEANRRAAMSATKGTEPLVDVLSARNAAERADEAHEE